MFVFAPSFISFPSWRDQRDFGTLRHVSCSMAIRDSTAGWVSGAHGFIKGFVCVCGAVATDKIGCGNALTIGCALMAFGYGGIANMTSFQHFVTAIMTVEPIGPRWMDVNNATLQQRQAANSMDIMRVVLMRRRF